MAIHPIEHIPEQVARRRCCDRISVVIDLGAIGFKAPGTFPTSKAIDIVMALLGIPTCTGLRPSFRRHWPSRNPFYRPALRSWDFAPMVRLPILPVRKLYPRALGWLWAIDRIAMRICAWFEPERI